MRALSYFHPQNIFIAFDKIDAQKPSYTLERKQATRRVFWTMACVAVCLLMIHYMKYSSTLRAIFYMLDGMMGQSKGALLHSFNSLQYAQLINYVWWTSWHVLGYVIIPFFVIRFLLKESFMDMGWRFNDTLKHWRGYLILLCPILFCIVLVSQGKDFVNHYPFYKLTGRSWFDFLAWEFLYLTQFICLEFFFRGFFLNALRPAIGANAIWVMCVPYLMIHFPKLWLEATGAILFGLFLGILALRSRSIWGGFFVHAGVAVSMDIAAMIKKGHIPTSFFPF